MKKEIVRFVKQKQEYNMKAPPTPKEEMMVGPILTDTKSEMLSRIPNKPEPKLLMSVGSSSPMGCKDIFL